MQDNSSFVIRRPPSFWRCASILLCGAITSTIAIAGASIGSTLLTPGEFLKSEDSQDFVASLTRWDGQHYINIAKKGYQYDPHRPSNVAFFPSYPLMGRTLMRLGGVSAEAALV